MTGVQTCALPICRMAAEKKELKKDDAQKTEEKKGMKKKASTRIMRQKKPTRRVVVKPKSTKAAKKPLSSYMLFTKAKRDEIQKQLKEGEKINEKLGQVWKAMSEEEKKPYVDEYKKCKEELEQAAKAKKEKATQGLKAAREAAKAKKTADAPANPQ